MTDGWRSVEIATLGEIVTGSTPPTSKPELFGRQHPFLTPSDMEFDRIRVHTARGISDLGASAFTSRMLPTGSVAVACIGSIGKVAMTEGSTLTNQQINSIVVDRDNHDPHFVFYLMRHTAPSLLGIAGGAATPIVNKTAFGRLIVKVPTLSDQTKIASVLAAYDKLIESNLRRIEILEEMAQALYREWFVDFRSPGSEQIQRADSRTGPVPSNWAVGTISDLGEIVTGTTPPTKEGGRLYGTGAPFLTPSDIGEGRWVRPRRRLSPVGAERYVSKLVPAGAVCFTCIGSIGAMCVASELSLTNQQINTVIPRALAHSEFVYQHLQHFKEHISNHAGGAATPLINKTTFAGISVPIPPPDLVQRFGKVIRPTSELIDVLSRQCSNLRSTRDLLLPKLLSREIDVSDLDIDTDWLVA